MKQSQQLNEDRYGYAIIHSLPCAWRGAKATINTNVHRKRREE